MCERTDAELQLPMPSSQKQKDEESIEVDVLVDKQEPSSCRKACEWCVDFYFTNEFLFLVVVVILLAKAYPPLGAEYLRPEITATWIAVIFIFCTYSIC
jgi:sodium/bile acid cotransporter 7